jgi:hypothetical protein
MPALARRVSERRRFVVVDGDASRGSGGRFETSIRLEQRPTPKQIAGTKCAIA